MEDVLRIVGNGEQRRVAMLERNGVFVADWMVETDSRLGNRAMRQRGSIYSSHGASKTNDTLSTSEQQPRRPILDSSTQNYLGMVRHMQPTPSSLLRWFTRPKWQIVETDDDSLLLTIVCPWWFRRVWEVYDAVDNLVCTIIKNEIYDSLGYLRATIIATSTSENVALVKSRDQGEIGRICSESGGFSLFFDAAIAEDPYSKMALLAAAIAHRQFAARM